MTNDLTTPQNVFDYLTNLSERSGNPFLARLRPRSGGVDELSGGNSNYVWRVWLDVPMAIVDSGAPLSWGEKGMIETIVVKHTKPFVRGWKELSWSTQRQVIHIVSESFKKEPTDQSLGIRSRGDAPCRSVANETLRPPAPRNRTPHLPL